MNLLNKFNSKSKIQTIIDEEQATYTFLGGPDLPNLTIQGHSLLSFLKDLLAIPNIDKKLLPKRFFLGIHLNSTDQKYLSPNQITKIGEYLVNLFSNLDFLDNETYTLKDFDYQNQTFTCTGLGKTYKVSAFFDKWQEKPSTITFRKDYETKTFILIDDKQNLSKKPKLKSRTTINPQSNTSFKRIFASSKYQIIINHQANQIAIEIAYPNTTKLSNNAYLDEYFLETELKKLDMRKPPSIDILCTLIKKALHFNIPEYPLVSMTSHTVDEKGKVINNHLAISSGTLSSLEIVRGKYHITMQNGETIFESRTVIYTENADGHVTISFKNRPRNDLSNINVIVETEIASQIIESEKQQALTLINRQ